MVKSPFAVLTALPAAPAGISLTFTVAPATGFPSGSTRVPVMAPRPACANTLDASNHRTEKTATHLFIRAFSANHTPDLSRLPVHDKFRPLGNFSNKAEKEKDDGPRGSSLAYFADNSILCPRCLIWDRHAAPFVSGKSADKSDRKRAARFYRSVARRRRRNM